MTVDSSLVDRIVHGVLQQLGTAPPAARTAPTAKPAPAASTPPPSAPAKVGTDHRLAQAVITGRLIEEQVPRTASAVVVPPRAIITPAALDVLRARKLVIRRETAPGHQAPPATGALLALVVRNSPAVERLCRQKACRRELLGCPDDAARLAISSLARGDAAAIVIFAAQNHRAACFANRNAAVKAAAVSSYESLRSVLEQLRVNLLCIDPTALSDFELTRMIDLFQARRAARS
jgi:hypothetical protein